MLFDSEIFSINTLKSAVLIQYFYRSSGENSCCITMEFKSTNIHLWITISPRSWIQTVVVRTPTCSEPLCRLRPQTFPLHWASKTSKCDESAKNNPQQRSREPAASCCIDAACILHCAVSLIPSDEWLWKLFWNPLNAPICNVVICSTQVNSKLLFCRDQLRNEDQSKLKTDN